MNGESSGRSTRPNKPQEFATQPPWPTIGEDTYGQLVEAMAGGDCEAEIDDYLVRCDSHAFPLPPWAPYIKRLRDALKTKDRLLAQWIEQYTAFTEADEPPDEFVFKFLPDAADSEMAIAEDDAGSADAEVVGTGAAAEDDQVAGAAEVAVFDPAPDDPSLWSGSDAPTTEVERPQSSRPEEDASIADRLKRRREPAASEHESFQVPFGHQPPAVPKAARPKERRGGRKRGSRNKTAFIALAVPELLPEELADLYVTSFFFFFFF